MSNRPRRHRRRREQPSNVAVEAQAMFAHMAQDMEDTFGVPAELSYECIGRLATSGVYQCAVCLAVHSRLNCISIFADDDSGTFVMWIPCVDCLEKHVGPTPDGGLDLSELSELGETALMAWIDGTLEPQGSVVILGQHPTCEEHS